MPAPIPPNGETATHPPPHSPELDLRTLLQVLAEKSWIILLLTVASLLMAAGYLQRSTPLYSSTATLQVEQHEQKIIMMDKTVPQEDLREVDIMQTIVQTLKARSLLERVIDTNGLAADPRFVGRFKDKPTREALVKALTRMVDVRLRVRTRLIDVTVVHPVPELTDKIANSIVREFMQLNTEQSVSSAEAANVSLLQEADRLKKKLQNSENALQAYREETGSASLDQQRQDIVNAKLKELSTRVTEAKSARIKGQSDLAQLEVLGTNIQALMVLAVVANDPKVVEIQTTIHKLESDLANLRQRYKEKHPKYIQAVSEIEQWRITFTNAVLKVPQTLKAANESAKASEEALADALRKQETAAIELNKLAIHYNVLAREVESDRALYEAVLNQMKQTSVTKEAEQPTKVRIVQPGYRPELPFSPKPIRVLLIGLLGGLFGGLCLAFALNALDHSFKTVDQVEGLLHLPVLGAVPTLRELRKNKSALIIADSPHSAGAEAFRTLRTSVAMLGKAQDRRSFIITSALPSEGKTFTTLNFAASLAQQGLRTLVIDGDLRKPSVRESLTRGNAGESHPVGVTDYLTGQKKLQELVCPTALDKLFYIPAGTLAPNPAELLAQGAFSDLVKEALQEFDRVVVDSAPIHAVSDTLLIVGTVSTVCLVVRATKTPRRAVVRSIKLLRNAQAALSGIVLNCLPRRRRLGYGYYYYNPYYDYAYYGKYSRKGVYGAGQARQTQPGRERQDKTEQTSRNNDRTE
jgi:capsular exopolysaccharide synthesis family protein